MTTDRKVELKVGTPAGVYEGVFELADQISEVIAIIVKGKGLAEGDAFELYLDDQRLSPDSKLRDWNLADGTVLVLVATGSAV
jgi:hypothetical protein